MTSTIFVCAACGKRSRDRYGDRAIDRGWDESCFLHAVECFEDSIELGATGRVMKAQAVPEPTTAND